MCLFLLFSWIFYIKWTWINSLRYFKSPLSYEDIFVWMVLCYVTCALRYVKSLVRIVFYYGIMSSHFLLGNQASFREDCGHWLPASETLPGKTSSGSGGNTQRYLTLQLRPQCKFSHTPWWWQHGGDPSVACSTFQPSLTMQRRSIYYHDTGTLCLGGGCMRVTPEISGTGCRITTFLSPA